MINFWDTTFLVGPFMGPALAGYLGTAIDWRGAFAVLVALYAVSTILVLVFGRETYFDSSFGATKGPTFVESLLGKGGALAVRRPSLSGTAATLIKCIFRTSLLLVGRFYAPWNKIRALTFGYRYFNHGELHVAHRNNSDRRLLHPRSTISHEQHRRREHEVVRGPRIAHWLGNRILLQ